MTEVEFAELTEEVVKLQKKCQNGFPRHMIDESNDLHADCYGMLGRLRHELGKALKIE
jgi:hypothetical protein